MDKKSSPRQLVRSVQNELPEAAPSSIMSDSSMISVLLESDLVKEHKSFVDRLFLLLIS